MLPLLSRPVGVCLVALSIFIAGLIDFITMPITPIPSVAAPVVEVSTEYPGASASVTEKSVTAPLRDQLSRIPGLQRNESYSSDGLSRIVLTFAPNEKLDVATQDIQSAINSANRFLPGNLPYPPVYRKFNPSDAPVVRIAATAANLDADDLFAALETRLAPRLSRISGVGNVVVGGGRRRAVRIVVDLARLRSVGLTPEDLRDVITNANVLSPKGLFESNGTTLNIETNDVLHDARAFEAIPIQTHGGSVLPLSAVASVSDGSEQLSDSEWYNGQPALLIEVYRQPNANILALAQRVKAMLVAERSELPQGVTLSIVSDRSIAVTQSMQATRLEVGVALLAVAIVVIVFFRNFRVGIIPILAIPVVLAATVITLSAVGATLNPLTMMALAIGSSFAVDDAIVVLENIVVWYARAKKPLSEAISIATRRIRFSIIGLSACVLAVLVPTYFLPGAVGRIFHDIVIALSATVVYSAVASLTLTPVFALMLLRLRPEKERALPCKPGPWRARFARWHLLVVARPSVGLVVLFVSTLVAVLLIAVSEKQLLPLEDTRMLQGQIVAPVGRDALTLAGLAMRAQAIVAEAPEVESSSIAMSHASATGIANIFDIYIALRDTASAVEVPRLVERLNARLASAAGLHLHATAPAAIPLDVAPVGSSYRVQLSATGEHVLCNALAAVIQAAKYDSALRGVWSPDGLMLPTIHLSVDRDLAARYGVSMATIDDTLSDMNAQRIVSTVYDDATQRHVVLSSAPLAESGWTSQTYLRSAGNGLVPLSAFTTSYMTSRPAIRHYADGVQVADLYFELAPHVSLSVGLAHLRALVSDAMKDGSDRIDLGGAKGKSDSGNVRVMAVGSTQIFELSEVQAVTLLITGCVCIFLVLGILFESLAYPLCVLASIPISLCGAAVAFTVSGVALDIVGLLAVLLVMGIVMKNGILLVDAALRCCAEGLGAIEAVGAAMHMRFRPILMTTIASALSTLPMILSTGAGAAFRRPLAIAVVGGLAWSQIASLYATGALFVLLRRAGFGATAGAMAAVRPQQGH